MVNPMAPPPDWNPVFRLIPADRLPEVLRPLAPYSYWSAAYAPGPPGQQGTSGMELYFDLTSPSMPEDEQRRWQNLLGSQGDLHFASTTHRSRVKNWQDVMQQLASRLGHPPQDGG